MSARPWSTPVIQHDLGAVAHRRPLSHADMARHATDGPTQPLRATNAPPTLAVSLHDVAPATWPACERVLRAIDAVAPVRVALLVVPRYRGIDSARDRGFLRAIERRIARGDEVVLHGWTHVDDMPLQRPLDLLRRRVYTAGEGEFAALDRMETLRRVQAGVQWFGARGWPLRGFVAPAWLMSRAAREALVDTPLQYAATRRRLLLLAAGTAIAAPSFCWSTRSRTRRALSRVWNALLGAVHAQAPLLRLALHPNDADHADVLASWQAALLHALHTRRARTEGEVADDWIAAVEPLTTGPAPDAPLGAVPARAEGGALAREQETLTLSAGFTLQTMTVNLDLELEAGTEEGAQASAVDPACSAASAPRCRPADETDLFVDRLRHRRQRPGRSQRAQEVLHAHLQAEQQRQREASHRGEAVAAADLVPDGAIALQPRSRDDPAR